MQRNSLRIAALRGLLVFNTSQLLIGQLNAAASPASLAELFLALPAVDAVCLSDPPKNVHSSLPSLGAFNIESCEDSLAVLILRSDFDYDVLPPTSRSVGVLLRLKDGITLALISSYLQPGTASGLPELDSLITAAKEHTGHLVLGGDLNGHSPLWGLESLNSQGALVEELLSAHQLTLLHGPDAPPTHVDTRGTSHWLDLTCASSTILPRLITRTVLPYATPSSDHHLITTTLSFQSLPLDRRTCWNWVAADWEMACAALARLWPLPSDSVPLLSRDEIDAMVSSLTDRLNWVQRNYVPHKVITSRSKHWFDSEVRSFYKRLTTAAPLRWSASEADRVAFTQLRAEFQRLVARKKQESFQQWLNTTDEDSMWTSFQRLARAKNRAPCHLPASLLAAQFFPPLSAAEAASQAPLLAQMCRYSSHADSFHVFPSLSTDELRAAIFSGRELACPGNDGIFGITLRQTFSSLQLSLLDLFSGCLRLAYFPCAWRSAYIVPIRKPNRPNDATGYRPIALLSCFGKVLERLLCRRFTTFMERACLWPRCQFGFRRCKTTLDPLWTLTHAGLDALEHHQQLVVASLDLSSAYDRVSIPLLWTILSSLHLPAYLLRSLTSFLSARTAVIGVSSAHSVFTMDRGVPQGSCLSPALFITYLISLPGCLVGDTKMLIYADDICLYHTLGRQSVGSCDFQRSLDNVGEWCRRFYMRLNPNKCQFLRICRLRIFDAPCFTLLEQPLRAVPTLTYLGIVLDAQLTFRPHLDYVLSAARRRIGALRAMSHPLWGSASWIIRRLYLACVVPLVNYGSCIWSHRLHLSWVDAQLAKVSRLAALSILGCSRLVSTNSLCALADLPDLTLSLRLSLMRFGARKVCQRQLPASADLPSSVLSPQALLIAEDRRLRRFVPSADQWIPLRSLQWHHLHRYLSQCSLAVYHLMELQWHSSTTSAQLLCFSWPRFPGEWYRHLTRVQVRALSTFLSGHSRCAAVLFRLSLSSSPYCPFCDVLEDTQHLLVCPTYLDLRLRFFGSPFVPATFFSCLPALADYAITLEQRLRARL